MCAGHSLNLQIEVPERVQYETILLNMDQDVKVRQWHDGFFEMEIRYLKRKYEDDWMKYYPYHLDKNYDDENGKPYNYGFDGEEEEDEDDWWRK
jgi:hypothetical protein